MLFCTAVAQSGIQPHFSMKHKEGIWTHSDPKTQVLVRDLLLFVKL